MSTPLQVESLDKQIRRILLDRILSGSMAPGANLNEAPLAEELEVSRTPLRQALSRLEQDGFLYTEPNRGFFVSTLSSREAEELYPILCALECLALKRSGLTLADLDRLDALNQSMSRVDPQDAEAAVHANDAWHKALLVRCSNNRLRALIATVRQQVYRYEISFFSPGAARLAKSVELHRRILDALRSEDAELACHRLEEHWQADLHSLASEPCLRW